jgi:hypothetical protein
VANSGSREKMRASQKAKIAPAPPGRGGFSDAAAGENNVTRRAGIS